MGALHEGHLTLVRLARQHAGGAHVAVSIYVNPTQFNEPADFQNYPRVLEADLALLESQGVEMVFAPIDDEMYPLGEPQAMVDIPSLTWQLEGAYRPGHFRGVCQVVLKLLSLVQPEFAVFGMKDFQQLRVIEALVRGLNLPTEIVRGQTVRDPDGLAMSSRNRRLTPEQRQRALAVPAALQAAEGALMAGETDPPALVEKMVQVLEQRGPAQVPLRIDYAAVVDPVRLESLPKLDRPALLAIAVHVGLVRLIDNRLIAPGVAAEPPGA